MTEDNSFKKFIFNKIISSLSPIMKKKPVLFLVLIFIFVGMMILFKNIFFSVIIMIALAIAGYTIIKYISVNDKDNNLPKNIDK